MPALISTAISSMFPLRTSREECLFYICTQMLVFGGCSAQSCLGEWGGLFSWGLSPLPSSLLPPVSISLLYHPIFQAAARVVFIKLSMAPCWILTKVQSFKQAFRGLMIHPNPLPVFRPHCPLYPFVYSAVFFSDHQLDPQICRTFSPPHLC